MNIEEIKSEWIQYNQKLSVSQRLNEHLILSMIRERSGSRLAKIRQDNFLYLLLMFFTLIFLVAIFAGNPFDFKYTLQYFPYAILVIGVLMSVGSLCRNLIHFNVDVNKTDLAGFLNNIILVYEKHNKMQAWYGFIMFSAGILSAFSFLPKKLEHKALWQALGETMIMLVVTVLIYVIALKLGLFKNRKKEAFENDLKELNQLKQLSSE
ncbi:MAG TPA: hypothetical protein VK616_17030 [Flavitalea sp.]|nr:hypothetical protein [Flavitalea sp.]HTF27815.1 hypothetical protein [Flavitalea sp.]